jgi:hypothetical protein
MDAVHLRTVNEHHSHVSGDARKMEGTTLP